MRYQTVGQKEIIDRKYHVWKKNKSNGSFKCVLCGGVTKMPTLNEICEKYEYLDEEERGLCPQRKPQKR